MCKPKLKDFYKVLELEQKCSKEQIKTSFRTLSKKYHPDMNNSDDAHVKFIELNNAYKILSDDEKRIKYDKAYEKHYVKVPPTNKTTSSNKFADMKLDMDGNFILGDENLKDLILDSLNKSSGTWINFKSKSNNFGSVVI